MYFAINYSRSWMLSVTWGMEIQETKATAPGYQGKTKVILRSHQDHPDYSWFSGTGLLSLCTVSVLLEER